MHCERIRLWAIFLVRYGDRLSTLIRKVYCGRNAP
jgi:hypothetical protein